MDFFKLQKTDKVSTSNTGAYVEKLACDYLIKQGMTLIKKNHSCRYGEIDLIMNDSDYVVFVEVRYRSRSSFGQGFETIDSKKQRKIAISAEHFLQKKGWSQSKKCRFDVITGCRNQCRTGSIDLEWIKDAFTT